MERKRAAGQTEILHAHYSTIISQIATGVFIIEPRVPGDLTTMTVTMVNEMGVRFFGRQGAIGDEILDEACN